MRASRSAAWIAVTACAIACNEGGSSSTLDVSMVDRTGVNAAEVVDEGELEVVISQDDEVLPCSGALCRAPIRNGQFELGFAIQSLSALTRIHARIRGAPTELIGASPPFQPFGEGLDLGAPVQLVLAAPASCGALTLDGSFTQQTPRLTTARTGFAAIARRGLIVLAGGVDAAGDSSAVDVFDGLTADLAPLQTWSQAVLGPARGVPITDDVSLIVGDRGAYMLQSALGPPAPRSFALHPGASSQSAVVDRGSDGAAVVGGIDSASITWIDEVGAVQRVTYASTPRSDAAVAALGGGLWIVGGASSGSAVEFARDGLDGEARETTLAPTRGGWLVPAPDGEAALYVGFTDESGRTSGETYVLRGCRDACTVEPGPPWTRVRARAGAVRTAAGALWIAGGESDGAPVAETDRVHWADGVPVIEAGPNLATPRTDVVVFEHASGSFVVAGGRGIDGFADHLELCVPAALDPLGP